MKNIGREVFSLNRDWLFNLEKDESPFFAGAKTNHNFVPFLHLYEDGSRETVSLPHDWVVAGPFSEKADQTHGHRPRGAGWYFKTFTLDEKDKGRHYELQFDAAAVHAQVYVNGILVHRNFCGYTSFYVDITPYLEYKTQINTLFVRVDARHKEGWWYEGGGLYRGARLVTRAMQHIETDGIYANPVRKGKTQNWEIPLEVSVANFEETQKDLELDAVLLNPDGKSVLTGSTKIRVKPQDKTVGKIKLNISEPTLWALENPALYTVKISLKDNGSEIDRDETTCGFRTIRFDANKGFFLNDKYLKIHGTCNHQDHAGVGVAVPPGVEEFRIKTLQKLGCNAIRTAHNSPSKTLLDACDRLGMMVMDEVRRFGCTEEVLDQLRWHIRRDRNRPCVILWSIMNEEPLQEHKTIGPNIARKMVQEIRKLDTTRPATAALSGDLDMMDAFIRELDVGGNNYHYRDYDTYHKLYPDKPLVSTEDTSAVMTRGVYVTDRKQHILSSYDDEKSAHTQREAWRPIAERDFVAGCFIWTGFDYRGESTPLTYPTVLSSFGILDLCGFPKAAALIRQAQWIKDRPILHLIPHWNDWKKGEQVRIMAMTNTDQVEVFLNGVSLGKQQGDIYNMNFWEVAYEPGVLEAVGYDSSGKELIRTRTETTGKPHSVKLTTYRDSLKNDGEDAFPVTVEVLDSKGRHVPTANNEIEFEVTGAAQIIGLGNGDPNSHEPEQGNKRRLFNGYAQVIVQGKYGAKRNITFKATAKGLKAGLLKIKSERVPAPKLLKTDDFYKKMPPLLRCPELFNELPDINIDKIADSVKNWIPVKPGELLDMKGKKFVMFALDISKEYAWRRRVFFTDIVGKAHFWCGGLIHRTKLHFERSSHEIYMLRRLIKPKYITIVVEAAPGEKTAGIPGEVLIEKIKFKR
ncbi:MAG: glycoside hydrolase family 2 protein [Lentisphaerae bacterium]|nr:glycoside hydrolase family 2 protein [Lentisphaerota bacterium]